MRLHTSRCLFRSGISRSEPSSEIPAFCASTKLVNDILCYRWTRCIPGASEPEIFRVSGLSCFNSSRANKLMGFWQSDLASTDCSFRCFIFFTSFTITYHGTIGMSTIFSEPQRSVPFFSIEIITVPYRTTWTCTWVHLRQKEWWNLRACQYWQCPQGPIEVRC